MKMTQTLKELINDQIVLAQELFVRDVCQIADGQVEELFGDEETILVHYIIEADNGRSYSRYLKIDLDDESHELVSERDFEDAAEELEELNDLIPEL